MICRLCWLMTGLLLLGSGTAQGSTRWFEGIVTGGDVTPGQLPKSFEAKAINYYRHVALGDITIPVREETVFVLDGRAVPPNIALRAGRRFYSANSLLISLASERAVTWAGVIKEVTDQQVTLTVTLDQSKLDQRIPIEPNARFVDNGNPVAREVLLEPGQSVRVLAGRPLTVDILSEAASARAYPDGVNAWAEGFVKTVEFGGEQFRLAITRQKSIDNSADNELTVKARCMLDGRLARETCDGVFEGNAVLFVRGEKRPGAYDDNVMALPFGADRLMGTIKEANASQITVAVPGLDGFTNKTISLPADTVYLLDGNRSTAATVKAGQHVIVFEARRQTFERFLDDTERASWLLSAGGENAVAQILPLLNAANPSVRRDAVRALGRIGSPAAIDQLIGVFHNRYESVRRVAVQELSRLIAEPLVRDKLACALSGANEESACHAARAFQASGPSARLSLDTLIQAAQGDAPVVAKRAAAAIVAANPEKDLPVDLIPMLIGEMNEGDSHHGYVAAKLLVRYGKPVIPAMLNMIRQETGMTQRAVFVLGELGPAAAETIPDLRQIQQTTKNGLLKKMVGEALAKIEKPPAS